jgi:O-antigen/teichoic acid export membrane protein
MAGSIATGLMSQVVLVVSGIVVARALGPQNRGVLALVLALSAIATQMGSLGTPLAFTYWIAGERANQGALFHSSGSFRRLQLTVVTAAQAVLILVVVAPKSPRGFLWVAIISLVATGASLSQMYGLAVLQGMRKFAAFNMLRILGGALYATGVVGLWIANDATLVSVMLVVIMSTVIAAGATWVVVRQTALVAATDNIPPTRRLVSFGLRSLLGASPPLETFRLDQLVVGLALPTVALGYYVVALAFTNLSRFIGQSIGMVTYPRVAAADSREARLHVLRGDFVLGVVVSGSSTGALIMVVPRILPFFFGREFASAETVAQILLVGAFFASVRKILIEGTRGLGKPGWGTVAESVTLVAVPVVVVGSHYAKSLIFVASAIAAANLVALLVLAPALFGLAERRVLRSAGEPLHRTAVRAQRLIAPRLAWVGAGSVVALLAGLSLAVVSPRYQGVVVAAVGGGAALLILAATASPQLVASLFVYGGVAVLAMNSLRIGSSLTISDGMFAGAGVVLVPRLASDAGALLRGRHLPGLALIVCGALLGTMASGNASASIVNLVKLLIPLYALFLVVRLWHPSTKEIHLAGWLWIASAATSASWALVHASADYGRPPGLSVHPNHLALTCVLALGLSLALLTSPHRIERVTAIGTCALLVSGILASGSRAGLIGAAAAFGVTSWMLRAHLRRLLVLSIVGATTALFASSYHLFAATNALARLLDPSGALTYQSDLGRSQLLAASVHTVLQHPLTGVGLGSALQAHDIWLQMLASGGLLAVIGFVLVAADVVGPTVTMMRVTPPSMLSESGRRVAVGLMVGFIGYLVAGCFQNALWDRYIWFTPALLAMVWSSAPRDAHRGDATSCRRVQCSIEVATRERRVLHGRVLGHG